MRRTGQGRGGRLHRRSTGVADGLLARGVQLLQQLEKGAYITD